MNNRFSRFLIVGTFNTVLNIVLLNLFAFVLGASPSLANFLSIIISMCISFLLNTKYVFKSKGSYVLHLTFAKFVAVTLFSQLVIQQLSFLIFLKVLNGSLSSLNITSLAGMTEQFLVVNLSKLLAVCFSFMSTYILYKTLVFSSNTKFDERTDE